jgi:hypothetical protein
MASSDENRDAELSEEDPGLAGGGGPAATIHGDDDEAEEIGDELQQAPDDR